jgi:UDP-N-acetylmuramoyl-tripeptide--D-alanyl-D-alanine ligase
MSGLPQGVFAPSAQFSTSHLAVALRGWFIQRPDRGSSHWSLCTDSRLMGPGRVFVALRGPRHDAHNFVGEVLAAPGGAAVVDAAFADRLGFRESLRAGNLVLAVDDTLTALQDAAAFHRRRFSMPVVAITGSVGKTTTKDLLASILRRWASGRATEGNLNNHVGLPLSLLQLGQDDDWAVLEMGMNHAGEIARLVELARPRIRVVTAVAAAHLEELADLAGVAAAKSEIFQGASLQDLQVIPSDGEGAALLRTSPNADVLRVGRGANADLRVVESRRVDLESQVVTLEQGGVVRTYEVGLGGEHHALNAAMAVGVARRLGVPEPLILAGLAEPQASAGRGQILRGRLGATVFDDTYNANPASVSAALDRLVDGAGGRCVALLGDMLELGDASVELHRQVGHRIAELGLDLFVGVGPHMAHAVEAAQERGLENAVAVDEAAQAATLAVASLTRDDRVLVKGSRSVRMEDAVSVLLEEPA